MSVFLLSRYVEMYHHYTNLDKGKTIISIADGDKDAIIYNESIFDQDGTYYYSRVLQSVGANSETGCSLETVIAWD